MSTNHHVLEMENEFAELPIRKGANCTIAEMVVEKARDFALALSNADNCLLVECLKIEEGDGLLLKAGDEIVIFDIGLEVSQRPVHDIRYTERIAVLFDKEDKQVPFTFALRKSFPKVLHRISLYFEHPTCLCIYELSYNEIKLQWRSQQFLQDIRTWLTLTAEDKLHQDDQPLEPFILSSEGRLILPHDIKPTDNLFVNVVSTKPGEINLIAGREKTNSSKPFHLMFLVGDVQEHGIINRTPQNLLELSQFLLNAKIDLFGTLQNSLRGSVNDLSKQQSNLLLLVQLPKKGNNSIERDLYVFWSHDSIRNIGLALNIWSDGPTGLGLIFPYESANTDKAMLSRIGILTPYLQLSRDAAKIYSEYQPADNSDISIAQIGIGALGSQLFMNLARTGFGQWKLIDSDVLLPHNTVRHYLSDVYVGQPKATALAHEGNSLLNQPNFVAGIWEDYLLPTDGKAMDQMLTEADIVLDVSTSIPVERSLSRRKDLRGHCISMFLNPSGTDLVVLAEDNKRQFPLDVLEFQYYRALLQYGSLKGHLQKTVVIRYSNSCRDITSRISQDSVGLHAAIGSKKLKKLVTSATPEISVFRTNDESEVNVTNVPVSEYITVKRGEWEVYVDQWLIQILSEARLKKLPNETGGILIGGYDFERKRIYLVDSILSPKDSEETSQSYVRGIHGVKEILAQIDSDTAGHLVYAGEWHSHPEDCSVAMSDDDIILFQEIQVEMNAIGFPPLMLILGDNDYFQIYMKMPTEGVATNELDEGNIASPEVQ